MGTARAQGERNVPITFVPPPLENATYSIGIYTTVPRDKVSSRGVRSRQVRQLCEALPESAFAAGLNGLVTSWDGKDDQGHPVPPGRYRVRGCAVGAVKITGHETAVNDWQGMDALPVRTVEAIAFVPDDEGVAVLAESEQGEGYELMRYAGSDGRLLWRAPVAAHSALGARLGPPSGALEYRDGALVTTTDNGGIQIFAVADGKALLESMDWLHGIDATRRHFEFPRQSRGKDSTTWEISPDGVYQFAESGEALRHLGFKQEEPVPVAVAASPNSDRLYLLESTPDAANGWQRVRGLAWVSAGQENGQAVSNWQTIFGRDTHRLDRSLARPGSETSVALDLVENPLTPGKNRRMDVIVKTDATGASLVNANGLRLCRIGPPGLEAPCFLRRESPDSMTVLQAGGPQWGVFYVEGMKNMMMFDAGEIEMTAEGEKAHAEKAAEPPDL